MRVYSQDLRDRVIAAYESDEWNVSGCASSECEGVCLTGGRGARRLREKGMRCAGQRWVVATSALHADGVRRDTILRNWFAQQPDLTQDHQMAPLIGGSKPAARMGFILKKAIHALEQSVARMWLARLLPCGLIRP
jgi:hypothetical protein